MAGGILPCPSLLVGGNGSLWTVASTKANGTTYVGRPTAVVPSTRPVGVSGASFRHTFPANSLTVLALTTS